MGLHEVCRNVYHHFDRSKKLTVTRVKRNGIDDIVYQGYCLECGYVRIVYESELKDKKVIEAKMKR